jgi:hypothetical protein
MEMLKADNKVLQEHIAGLPNTQAIDVEVSLDPVQIITDKQMINEL